MQSLIISILQHRNQLLWHLKFSLFTDCSVRKLEGKGFLDYGCFHRGCQNLLLPWSDLALRVLYRMLKIPIFTSVSMNVEYCLLWTIWEIPWDRYFT